MGAPYLQPFDKAIGRSADAAIANAAADPREAGVFVAAVYTGSDLFVVRARHPAAEKLTQQIQSGQFRPRG